MQPVERLRGLSKRGFGLENCNYRRFHLFLRDGSGHEYKAMGGQDFVQIKALPHGVFLLTFAGEGEHRLSQTSMEAILSALDEVESHPAAAVLITTNEGRFFSNGLDWQYTRNASGIFNTLLERLLSFPMPTIAAICGHAAAGGCIFALAHDYRVMRADRGYIFLNEVEINIPIPAGPMSLIRNKLPVETYHRTLLSAQKYTGKMAEAAGIVHAAYPNANSTVEHAVERGTELAKKKYDRSVYKALKVEMYRTSLKELRITSFAKL